MELEVRKADKRLRKRVQIIVVLSLIAMIVGYLVFNKAFQNWLQDGSDMEHSVEKMILFVKILAYCVSIFSFLFGLYFLRIAILILRSHEFPYPKSKVMYDTKIVKGKQADIKGFIALFISLLILGIAISFPIYINSILQTLIHLPV